jgi:myo-inositol-1(or 4)-monophosphatase
MTGTIGGELDDALDAALLGVAVDAAAAAGEALSERFRDSPPAGRPKTGPMDLVSDADLEAEQLIVGLIAERRPDDTVLSEEMGARRGSAGEISWTVDPLDGTQNYLRDLPLWCVSIAAADGAGARVGVIHDPVHGETFAAVRGAGAWLGSAPLPLRSRPSRPEEMILAGSHRRAVAPGAARREQLSDFASRFGSTRETVAAALDFAWTAAARVDVLYHESKIKAWDKSAGELICREAGLSVHDLAPAADGERPRVLVCPPHLSHELLDLIA